ncbi:MAG: DUF1013 domain-containing protein [Aestuariivita sp.]|nr:DUF1013 domain-containing protein [Aestuariivita sp.]MCY4346470.1 DUF1013 domain-containing protein [Aestuariivita sp.]
MTKPLMAKATAVWLVDNTTISFKQIADFVEMHELEIQGIADGDVAAGVKGFDPIASNQLSQEEITAAENDPQHKLTLKFNPAAVGEEKRRGPRYTPLSKRQDKPAAILWLVKFHPELTDSQISKLVGTTKPTILAIRNRTHWNISNLQPVDPVALGLTKQSELDQAVQKAAERKAKETPNSPEKESRKLIPTEQSLAMETNVKIPTAIEGLESFSLGTTETPKAIEERSEAITAAENLFDLPKAGEADHREKPLHRQSRRAHR